MISPVVTGFAWPRSGGWRSGPGPAVHDQGRYEPGHGAGRGSSVRLRGRCRLAPSTRMIEVVSSFSPAGCRPDGQHASGPLSSASGARCRRSIAHPARHCLEQAFRKPQCAPRSFLRCGRPPRRAGWHYRRAKIASQSARSLGSMRSRQGGADSTALDVVVRDAREAVFADGGQGQL